MIIEVVVCIHLDQANAVGEISGIRSGGLYRYGFVISLLNLVSFW
jgi:hypothetical protein